MDTPNAAITLTDGAEAKIKELLASQEDASDQALRVAVRGGGCSGFQYALAFDNVFAWSVGITTMVSRLT